MLQKSAFWLLWFGFIGYAFFLAPPDSPNTLALIQALSTGQVEAINPAIVSLFNLMGVWPGIYGCLLWLDGHGQKLWVWPFALGMALVGAFALLPYLALRQPHPTMTQPKNWWLGFQDSRWLGLGLAIATIGLLGYGISQGNWGDFLQQWQTQRFINVMSLDFIMLGVLFPCLLGDDMARRGIPLDWRFRLVALTPPIGTVLYLTLRPPLPR